MTVKLSKTEKEQIINGKALYEILQKVLAREALIDRQKEHLWVAGLDIKGRLLVLDLVSLGNDWMTTADPVAVFARALQKESKNIVLAHNHPRGRLQPGKADLEVTQRMVTSGKLLQCPLIDHMIITETQFYSMRQHGHLEPMEKMDITQVFDDLAITKHLVEMQDKELEEKEAKEKAALKALAEKDKVLNAQAKEVAAERKAKADALKENAELKKQLAALQKKTK
jgi:DNA repair protein RadC